MCKCSARSARARWNKFEDRCLPLYLDLSFVKIRTVDDINAIDWRIYCEDAYPERVAWQGCKIVKAWLKFVVGAPEQMKALAALSMESSYPMTYNPDCCKRGCLYLRRNGI